MIKRITLFKLKLPYLFKLLNAFFVKIFLIEADFTY